MSPERATLPILPVPGGKGRRSWSRTTVPGLIGRVVPDGQALSSALEIAEMINANGPLAVEAIKRSVRATEGLSEVDGLAKELDIGWPIFATDDAKEGARAFAEKRPAEFKRR